MVEVEGTEEFEEWFLALYQKEAEAVARVVGLLEEKGVALGFPYTSEIKGAEALRELRVQSGGHPLRVFYAFDPLRRAVLLLGGDKTGDKRFYETFVPRAERIWTEYLTGLAKKEKRR
ncbi:MAG TPA: type II toxin-antitoxin system RelE/ParE family toxin [Candidatus Binataceae bacterium]|nr:type II toxin-antitoxin system RelE/ParE family toxin [Candidatus Binataceae bacterium]